MKLSLNGQKYVTAGLSIMLGAIAIAVLRNFYKRVISPRLAKVSIILDTMDLVYEIEPDCCNNHSTTTAQ